MTTLRPGHVVLYDNGWNHNNNGRPHVVLSIEANGFLKLCPLSSRPAKHGPNAQDPPIPARPSGLKLPSWVAATSNDLKRLEVRLVHHSNVNPRPVCWLHQAEQDAVLLTAVTQVKRMKTPVRVAS
jgi:hypothetical protein